MCVKVRECLQLAPCISATAPCPSLTAAHPCCHWHINPEIAPIIVCFFVWGRPGNLTRGPDTSRRQPLGGGQVFVCPQMPQIAKFTSHVHDAVGVGVGVRCWVLGVVLGMGVGCGCGCAHPLARSLQRPRRSPANRSSRAPLRGTRCPVPALPPARGALLFHRARRQSLTLPTLWLLRSSLLKSLMP